MLRIDKNRNDKIDFFETPTLLLNSIVPLLDKNLVYYDPCVGRGQIPKVLGNNGIKCFGSDIRSENIYGDGNVDFLNNYNKSYVFDAIIMNPPFVKSIDFINKCFELSKLNNKNYDIYVIEKISFLASKKRKDLMNNHLSSLFVMSSRPSFYIGDCNLGVDELYIDKKMSSTIDFAFYKFNLVKDKDFLFKSI